MRRSSVEERLMNKGAWGPGPWQSEPDRLAFECEGFQCFIKRVDQTGHLCGYVAVPPSHPWHGKALKARMPVADRGAVEVHSGPIQTFLEAAHEDDGCVSLDVLVQVHGGLTYAENEPPRGEASALWWLGFDCAHAGDLSPFMEAFRREKRWPPMLGNIYRDVAYVRAEVEGLARQAKAAAS